MDTATVRFQLRFTVTAHADTAFLTRQVTPEPGQSRKQMLELREFNLEFALFGAGALRENIENQRRAIQNFAAENFFEIAALSGRKFIVENHRVHVVRAAMFRKFLRLASADECSGDGRFQFLRPVADDFRARAGGEFVEFVERITRFVAVTRFEFEADEENPFGCFVVRDECFQLL